MTTVPPAGPARLLIVGGGPHGVHLAVAALRALVVRRDQILIVDPRERLLGRWLDLTSRFTMRHLRSPGVHHLDVRPEALREFSVANGVSLMDHAPPYGLPPLDVFNRHADALLRELGLAERHVRARVLDLEPVDGGGWVAKTSVGALRADNVALCLGDERVGMPAWAASLGDAATHVFDPQRAGVPRDARRLVIVGGGMTAAQAALHYAPHHDVTLLSRAPLRVRQFDADSAWMGPRGLFGFSALRDPVARRRAIDEARFPGSVPRDLQRALEASAERGALRHHVGEVTSTSAGALTLDDGAQLAFDHVLCATGVGRGRPGGPLVDALLARVGTPVAPCGFPIPDEDLRLAPGLYATGALAELGVGPTARNLLGARDAAQRVLDGIVLDTPFPTAAPVRTVGPHEQGGPHGHNEPAAESRPLRHDGGAARLPVPNE